MHIYSLWCSRILPINNFKTSNIICLKLRKHSPKSIDVIFHSRKSLLYHNDDPWVKKDTSVEFDVTMGSYDGAEVGEIVGVFMLDMLSKLFEKNSIGLHRDDGLSIFRNYNGHQSNKVRKDLTKLSKKYQLNLDIKCNLKTVDYLDISFDLNPSIYKPFNKPIIH